MNALSTAQLVLFDYDTLAPEVRVAVIEAAAKIRLHGKRAAESIVAIGSELARVKDQLPHGCWLPWLKAEFGWSEDTAGRFLNVARLSAQIPQFAEYQIDLSAIYLLARPSTPPEVIEEALAKAVSGDRVSHSDVRGALAGEKRSHRATVTPVTDDDASPLLSYDPVKRHAFEVDAELSGCMHSFSITNREPREVAALIDPVLRRRRLEDARRIVQWLCGLIGALLNRSMRRSWRA